LPGPLAHTAMTRRSCRLTRTWACRTSGSSSNELRRRGRGGDERPVHGPRPTPVAVDSEAQQRRQPRDEVAQDSVYLRPGRAKQRAELADGEVRAERGAHDDEPLPERPGPGSSAGGDRNPGEDALQLSRGQTGQRRRERRGCHVNRSSETARRPGSRAVSDPVGMISVWKSSLQRSERAVRTGDRRGPVTRRRACPSCASRSTQATRSCASG
jgi:hypothetical protein